MSSGPVNYGLGLPDKYADQMFVAFFTRTGGAALKDAFGADQTIESNGWNAPSFFEHPDNTYNFIHDPNGWLRSGPSAAASYDSGIWGGFNVEGRYELLEVPPGIYHTYLRYVGDRVPTDAAFYTYGYSDYGNYDADPEVSPVLYQYMFAQDEVVTDIAADGNPSILLSARWQTVFNDSPDDITLVPQWFGKTYTGAVIDVIALSYVVLKVG